ncbi:MAG: Fic family protein [Bacillota bacterium]
MTTDLRHRGGRYVRQPSGYRAFIPSGLPPNPPVQVDDEMQYLLSEANLSLGRLDGAANNLPNPDLFVYMYVRKEAVLSSQIEGTQTSLIELLRYESDAIEQGQMTDVTEVVNYVGAIRYGIETLNELPLSLRLMRNIHERLLTGGRGGERNPGRFRTSQNWIGPRGCTLSTATFVPPPIPEMRVALYDLEHFLHTDEPRMPFLTKVGLAHAQFETIHPFLDGNGRMGRLLISLLLAERKVLKRPLLYLSYYFKQHRGEYYERLQDIRDNGDWEGWLKFFLQGVQSVAEEATETAQRIVTLREEHRRLVRSQNGIALLERLYYKPLVTVQQVTDLLRVSFPAANNLIKEFCGLGILKETTGRQRNRIFKYEAYLDLFADPLTGTPDVEPVNGSATDSSKG